MVAAHLHSHWRRHEIICVEAHIGDQELSKAGQPKQKAEAGYFTEVGTCFRRSLEDGDDKLPMGLDFRVSARLLMETASERIEQMDQHGIDMKILSCSNPKQDTPADQAVELTQRANDKLAGVIQAAPSRSRRRLRDQGGFAALLGAA